MDRCKSLHCINDSILLSSFWRMENWTPDNNRSSKCQHLDIPDAKASLCLPPPAPCHTPHEALHEAGAGQDQVQAQRHPGNPGQVQDKDSEDAPSHWGSQLSRSPYTIVDWSYTCQMVRCIRNSSNVDAHVARNLICHCQLYFWETLFIQTS